MPFDIVLLKVSQSWPPRLLVFRHLYWYDPGVLTDRHVNPVAFAHSKQKEVTTAYLQGIKVSGSNS